MESGPVCFSFGGAVQHPSYQANDVDPGLLLKYLNEDLPPALQGQADDIMGDIDAATAYDWGTPERDAIAGAFQHAYRIQALACLIAAIISLVVCFPIKNVKLDSEYGGHTEEDGKKYGETVSASAKEMGEEAA